MAVQRTRTSGICRFYQEDHQLIRLKMVKVIIPADMSDRTNEEWLDHLRTPGQQQEAALADLRAIVMGVALCAFEMVIFR
jgi:hypothetical protein